MKNPEIIQLNKLDSHLVDKIDLFICSASFEDRCFKVAEVISKNIKHVLIFKNKADIKESNKSIKIKNANYLKSLFKHSEVIPISKSDPFFTSNQFVKEILKNNKTKRNILVDISTFTHEALLILMKVIDIFKNKEDKVMLAYNPAKDYCFETSKKEDKWLSKGIKEIRTVLGYPGSFSPYKKLHLIILVGFEVEKCIKLIEDYEPSILSFGIPNAKDSFGKTIHQVNFQRYKKLLSIYPNINEFKFSCVDPKKTMNQLIKLIEKYPDFNTVIAPMNNKLSTVGAGLAANKIDKVQISYARANLYNTKDYSLASENCVIFHNY